MTERIPSCRTQKCLGKWGNKLLPSLRKTVGIKKTSNEKWDGQITKAHNHRYLQAIYSQNIRGGGREVHSREEGRGGIRDILISSTGEKIQRFGKRSNRQYKAGDKKQREPRVYQDLEWTQYPRWPKESLVTERE